MRPEPITPEEISEVRKLVAELFDALPNARKPAFADHKRVLDYFIDGLERDPSKLVREQRN